MVNTLTAGDIRFVELAGTDLKWADVKLPNVAIPLTIENTGTSVLKDVQIDVTPFSGSGRTAMATVDKQLIARLEPSKPQLVTITATLPAAVTYRSIVRVRQKNTNLLTATIEIARTRGPAPIELTDAQAQLIEIDLLRNPGSATFQATVVGTGEQLKLSPPILKGVTYRAKAATTEAGFGTSDVGLKVEPAGDIEVGATDGWRQPVTMTLTGIRTPGRYDATVVFGGGSFTPVTTTLTVYARQSWRVAAGWIFAGVIVSLFLRVFGLVGRPSLLNKERANTLFRELDESAAVAGDDAYAIAVVQDVRRKFAAHLDDLSASGQLMNSGVLEVYGAKIAALLVWVQMRKRVKRLEPATLREPFEGELAAAEAMLRNRAADAAAIAQQMSILDAMPAAINQARNAELSSRLTEFRADLAGDDRPQVKALIPLTATVQRALDNDDYDAAAAELDRLQRRHIRILANDLANRISEKVPVGVEEADWSSATAAVAANLTAARNAPNAAAASEAFRSALTTFLRVVITGLAADVADKHDSNYAALYAKAAQPLDAALARLDEGKLLPAWRELDKAQKLYAAAAKAAATALGAAGTALFAAASAPAGLSGFDITTIFTGAESSESIARPDAMPSIRARRRAGEIVASVLILFAAILIGLQTLWIDQLTWGGWASMIAAFLWGVAFDQFSHAGLSALIRRT